MFTCTSRSSEIDMSHRIYFHGWIIKCRNCRCHRSYKVQMKGDRQLAAVSRIQRMHYDRYCGYFKTCSGLRSTLKPETGLECRQRSVSRIIPASWAGPYTLCPFHSIEYDRQLNVGGYCVKQLCLCPYARPLRGLCTVSSAGL